MSGKVFLSGGGNEKQTYGIDEFLLKNVKKILYIPIAWKNEDFESCKSWFTNMIHQHKKSEIKIDMIINLKDSPNLNDYGAIYIGGGNTFKLLKKIKESGFDRRLIEYYKNGGKIFGSSAGAIIFGKDINIALICDDADVNDVILKNTKGFNIINGYDLQVHYNNSQLAEHKKYILKTKNPIIAIPEKSALLVENGKYKVIGTKPITVITSNSSKNFSPNSEIIL